MPPIHLPAASAYQTYYVVAADMSTYDDHESINGCQMVLDSAQDAHGACDIARCTLEEGLVPIAAFDRAELLAILDTLAGHPLRPGEAYNLDRSKTDTEIAAVRAETAAWRAE